MIEKYRAAFNVLLQNELPQYFPDPTDILHDAMQYSVFGGGKRLRPLLVYAAGDIMGADRNKLNNAAVAVELIHAYSLIHDDLPEMDNDDLRHGKPSCHKVFGEAIAILAGDALQSLAFEILAQNACAAQIIILAKAIGASGMALGQSLDMQAENKITIKNKQNIKNLKNIHAHKTAALISASLELGAACGENSHLENLQDIKKILREYGQLLGLLFQVQDDILDIESATETLGKTQGADISRGKTTYPALLGLHGAKQELRNLYKKTREYLNQIPSGIHADGQLLWHIQQFIEQRCY